MLRFHSRPKLFKWLRKKLNIAKPTALGLGEWNEWKNNLRKTRPIAYFLTETLPDLIEMIPDALFNPINEVRVYFVNRFIDKTHYLRTKLTPGKWYEFDERLLHGCFEELVDFVEIEKASMHLALAYKEERAKFNEPWWREYQLLRWARWRCPEAGIAHLQWEIELIEPNEKGEDTFSRQARVAQETLMLYHWWKFVRSKRKDVYDEVGLTDFDNEMDQKYGKNGWRPWLKNTVLTAAEQQKYQTLLKQTAELEEIRYQEDDNMLMRLIKIRRSLWT